MIRQARMNAWIFDRIFNGAWEYTNPDKIEDDDDNFHRSNQYFTPSKRKQVLMVPKKTFSDIFGRAKDILMTDVDS